MDPSEWAIAVVLAAVVSLAAMRVGALSAGGAAVAAVVGTVVMGSGGLDWATVLLFFFLSASVLTALPKGCLQDTAGRNGRQVAANAGVATAAAALHLTGVEWAGAVFCGALAAACADTWATEIGVRYGGTPRSILGGSASVGDSGAVSWLGTLAGLAGALSVGSLAALLGMASLGGVATAGMAGMFLDSVLGAAIQVSFRCPACGARGESHRCPCGHRRLTAAGIRWVDNDVVNFAATLCGALVALILA
jgi:uncharacterized protein (TIGR00297 family)